MSRTYKFILDFAAKTENLKKEVGGIEGMLKGAAIAAGALFAADKILDAAKGVADYAKEISNTKIAVETLAGVHGAAASKMAGEVTAISRSYKQDINETIKTSNVLMKTFGESSTNTFDLLNLGLSGAANANGDLLRQISEYSPHFAEAGLSAEQMFAVIAQGNKMGIFDDKAADSIKEASIRLREMTPITKAAIDGIGLSSEEIAKSVQDGSMSMFDVMQLVSEKMGELPAQAPEVGAALADIFGGPGEDAVNFIRSLSEVDSSMQGLINDSNSAQAEWTNELARFHELGAQAFGGVSEALTRLQTQLLKVASFFLENIDIIIAATAAVGGYMLVTQGAAAALKIAAIAQKVFNAAMAANPIGLIIAAVVALVATFVKLYKENEEFRLRVDFAAKWAAAALNKAWISIQMGGELMWEGIKSYFMAMPRIAGAAWSAIKRIFAGESPGAALKEELKKVAQESAEGAKKVAEKYNEKLKGIEMPEWAEYYDANKTKEAAKESGKEAGKELKDGVEEGAKGMVLSLKTFEDGIKALEAKKGTFALTNPKAEMANLLAIEDKRRELAAANLKMLTDTGAPTMRIMPEMVIEDFKFDMSGFEGFETTSPVIDQNFQIAASYGQIENAMHAARMQAEGLGQTYDANADRQQLLAEQIRNMIDSGLSPQSEAVSKLREEYAQLQEKEAGIAAMNEVMTGVFGGMASQLSEGAASMAEFGQVLKGSIRDTISALISQGVAALVASAMNSAASMGPFGLAAAPVLAAAAGGLAKTLFNAAIPAFAAGGVVSGKTLGVMGEYPNASINPEVISPLSDLEKMLGTRENYGGEQMQLIPETRLRGEDIVMSYRRSDKKMGRRR